MLVDQTIQELHQNGPFVNIPPMMLQSGKPDMCKANGQVLNECKQMLSSDASLHLKALECIQGLALCDYSVKEWVMSNHAQILSLLGNETLVMAVIETLEVSLVDCSKTMRWFEESLLSPVCDMVKDRTQSHNTRYIHH
jgi:hypothetical protein